jgi:hypothetical protein
MMAVVAGGPKARRAYRLLLGVELLVNTMLGWSSSVSFQRSKVVIQVT